MSEPLDLDAIRARFDATTKIGDAQGFIDRLYASSRDVLALLAEIERLRSLVRRVQVETVFHHAWHAKGQYAETCTACMREAWRGMDTSAAMSARPGELERLRDLAEKARAYRDARYLDAIRPFIALTADVGAAGDALLAAVNRLYPPDGEP